jgi:O-antigen/teichoic acid export membrane protein
MLNFSQIRSTLNRHLKGIQPFLINSLLIVLYSNFDKFLLGIYFGSTSVGYLVIGLKIPFLVLAFILASSNLLLPKFSKLSLDDSNLKTLINSSFNNLLLFTIPLTIGILFLSNNLILVFFGNQFLDSSIVLSIVSLIVLFIGVSNFFGIQVFISLGYEKLTNQSILFGFLTNIVANFILVPAYGFIGASLSILITEFTVVLFQLFYILKFKLINFNFSILFDFFIGSLLFLVPILLFKLDNIYLDTLMKVFAAIVIYFLYLSFRNNQVLNKLFKSMV